MAQSKTWAILYVYLERYKTNLAKINITNQFDKKGLSMV